MKKNRYIVSTRMLLLLLFNTGWIFSLHAQKGWERMTDMPTSRCVLKSVEHNGKIYIIGGDNEKKKYEKCNEVYDIETDTWSVLASMDTPRVGHTLEVLNNKIYVIGGVRSVQQNYSNILEYDIETDEWITKCEMPEPRLNHFSEVIDGKIYISGGLTVKNGSHPGLLSSLTYDPANDQWDTIADLNHERHLGGSCIFDDKIYVFGGAPSGVPLRMAHRSIEIYDPGTDVWTVSDDEIPVPFMYGIVIALGDNILLLGGYKKVITAKCYNTIFKYVPASSDDKWIVMAPMPEERARMSGNMVNNYLHMFGGIVGIENAESMTDFSGIFPADNHWRLNLDSLSEYVSIPDTAFLHALIDEGVDTNEDSLISYAEAEAVISLNLEWRSSDEKISDLTGIEAFINLESLFCSYNRLTSLDVSACTRLKYLRCGSGYFYSDRNLLTNLDLSNNTALTHLDCSGNYLTSLDLSKNRELKHLVCAVNEITSLDITNNIKLEYLDLEFNQLVNLDLSNNSALETLICPFNLLTNLDVSNNTALKELICHDNQLTSLDVSNNPELSFIECRTNQLANLDVSNNAALKELFCYDNQLTNLDLSNNPELAYLDCGTNQLANLDVSKNEAITSLGLTDMPGLFDVCVWTMPFPPNGVHIYDYGSPNVYFTIECSDYLAPEITAIDTLFQPDYIEATSSENGMIYLLPEETDKDIAIIREACIDSVEAMADTPVNIPLSGMENGVFWLYARDSTGNISEPEAFTIMGVRANNYHVDHIRLYPNPTNKLLTIKTVNTGLSKIEISSLNGQILFSKEVEGVSNELDISSLKRGTYLITIRSRDYLTTRKVLKL